MRWLTLFAVCSLAALTALNWRAQVQTQQKLDALVAALADRPTASVLTPAAAPESVTASKEEGDKLAPYIIETSDLVLIEAVLKDSQTEKTNRPNSGQFQVRPDGTVGLGTLDPVFVAGCTFERAKTAIRNHLAKALPTQTVEVLAVDVAAYSSSKRYYVIFDSTDYGEQVFPFPLAGPTTVLDAIGNIPGLSEAGARSSIRVERSGAHPALPRQILSVDWTAITRDGNVKTNYALRPGDRIYVTRNSP